MARPSCEHADQSLACAARALTAPVRAARRGARNIVTRKLDLEQALGSTVRRPRHGPARTFAPAQLTSAPSFAQGSMGEIAVKHREQLVALEKSR